MRTRVACFEFALVAAAVAFTAGCGGRRASADPLTPSVYLDHALAIMRASDIYSSSVDWPAVTAEAHKLAAQATTASGTYAAIRYAVDALQGAGDLHARFYIEPEWTQVVKATGAAAAPSPPPAVSLVKGRLGAIALPAISSSPTSPNSRTYTQSTLARISSLQARQQPCGWIVDLRNDTGGDMYPMLLSVGPILGAGRLIGFADAKGLRYYVSYKDGTLSGGGYVNRAPLRVADFSPAPAVAVLTGQMTGSSGEVVTVAFRERPNTRSFGSPTMGATNGPLPHRLADGAVLFLGVYYYADRSGTVYEHPIKPDVSFAYTATPSAVEQAAEKWLLSTPACAR